MRLILTARIEENPYRDLAGLLVEARPGDEIVVESATLARAARAALAKRGATGRVTITIDPALVAEERARVT